MFVAFDYYFFGSVSGIRNLILTLIRITNIHPKISNHILRFYVKNLLPSMGVEDQNLWAAFSTLAINIIFSEKKHNPRSHF